jgi:hypothetical protein
VPVSPTTRSRVCSRIFRVKGLLFTDLGRVKEMRRVTAGENDLASAWKRSMALTPISGKGAALGSGHEGGMRMRSAGRSATSFIR